MPQTLFTNARIVTMSDDSGYGLIDDAALLVDGQRIEWVAPMAQAKIPLNANRVDCEGRLMTPGLIDCHTHLVFAGWRAAEDATNRWRAGSTRTSRTCRVRPSARHSRRWPV